MNKKKLSIYFCFLIFSIVLQCAKQQIFSISQKQTKIIVLQGDITKTNVDVIVNAANQQLQAGGGVCGAIFQTAGIQELQKACNQYSVLQKEAGIRCPTGQAVITDSFNLRASGIKYIVHAVGPDCRIITDNAQQKELLKNAYINSLLLVEKLPVSSIAFPFISSAIYGCPKKQAAYVAVDTVCNYIQHSSHNSLKVISFVLFSADDYDLFCSTIHDVLHPSIFQRFVQALKKIFNM